MVVYIVLCSLAYFLSGPELLNTVFFPNTLIGLGMYGISIVGYKYAVKTLNLILGPKELIFINDEERKEYKRTIDEEFNEPIERAVPLGSAVVILLVLIVSTISLGDVREYNLIIDQTLSMREGFLWVYQIQAFLFVAFWVFVIVVFADYLIILIHFHKYIRFLGVKKGDEKKEKPIFALDINYVKIQSSLFLNLGKSILLASLPITIMASITAVVGWINISIYEMIGEGIFLIILGVSYNVIVVGLLYSETLHIHNSIVIWKSTFSIFCALAPLTFYLWICYTYCTVLCEK